MKLYYHPASYNARRALAVARHVGAPVDVEIVDLMKGAHKSPDYLAINPNGAVPALVDGDLKLWESTAIALYLCEKQGSELLPTDPARKADVMRWITWGLAHFGRSIDMYRYENLVKGLFGLGPPDAAVLASAEAMFHRFAKVLEAHLAHRDWLAGELSVADYLVAPSLMGAEVTKVPLDGYPRIRAWWDRVRALPGWKALEG